MRVVKIVVRVILIAGAILLALSKTATKAQATDVQFHVITCSI